jgi:hypothetical protein
MMTLEEEVEKVADLLYPAISGPREAAVALARAAIAIIQPRAEAEGAAKERAAVVAWLPSQDRGDEYTGHLARAIKAGEHLEVKPMGGYSDTGGK